MKRLLEDVTLVGVTSMDAWSAGGMFGGVRPVGVMPEALSRVGARRLGAARLDENPGPDAAAGLCCAHWEDQKQSQKPGCPPAYGSAVRD